MESKGSQAVADSAAAELGEAVVSEQAPAKPSARRERWDSATLYGTFAIGAALTFGFSTDDPFITLRYAANLVHGHGLVFNIGERVEGFTSPLHVLLVSVMYILPGAHDLLKVKLLSLLFAVLTLVAARRLVRSIEFPAWGRTVCLVLVGGSWSLGVASGNGLETTLTCWLTTLLVAGLVRGDAVGRPILMAWCAAGITAVRPEGIFVALVLALISLVVEPRTSALWRRFAWFGGAVAAEIVILVARLAYYGQLLPNTYYTKRGDVSTNFHNGINYLRLLLPGVPTASELLVLAFAVGGAVSLLLAPNRRPWYVIGAVVAQILIILETGGDWMFGNRFFAPAVPMAAILVAKGVVELVKFSNRRWGTELRLVHITLCAMVTVVLGLVVVMPFVELRDPVWTSHGRLDDAALVSTGGYETLSSKIWPAGPNLLRCVPSGSLVAYSEIGYAGFERLDLRFLDTRGLTDKVIAHSAPTVLTSNVGVLDFGWFLPHSTVGSRILALKPSVVLTFDFIIVPLNVLDGAYKLRVLHVFPNQPPGQFAEDAEATYWRSDLRPITKC
jgi:hypothetical protein